MYDTARITPDEIQKHADQSHNLKLTPTHENNARINLLDLLITRQTNDLRMDIYRKPTSMNTTINYISNHPMEHKLAAYRYYISRMITLPLNEENRNKEWKIILNMARNSNSPHPFFPCGAATQRGSWPPHSRGFLDHTRRTAVGRTSLDE